METAARRVSANHKRSNAKPKQLQNCSLHLVENRIVLTVSCFCAKMYGMPMQGGGTFYPPPAALMQQQQQPQQSQAESSQQPHTRRRPTAAIPIKPPQVSVD